jgi:hypothetical protein
MTDHERKALAMLRMLQPAEILEFVDCIATAGKQGCVQERRRQQRIIGMLCALSDARAALDA